MEIEIKFDRIYRATLRLDKRNFSFFAFEIITYVKSVFYKKGDKNFMVARNLQKLSLLSDGVRWDNFCKYRATIKL